jgi:hypothetical protein
MSGPKPTPAYDRVMKKSIQSVVYSYEDCACTHCVLATNGDGYPVVSIASGKMQTTAAKVVWEHSHGRVPDGLVVCHKCNNRACVNIDHLFVDSHSSRAAIKVLSGRARGNQKLTKSQAVQIIQRCNSGERNADLAREYGVTPRAISNIKNGRSWKSLAR